MPLKKSSSVPVICLLAGFSERMGKPKQHVLVGDRTFLGHLLQTLGKFEGKIFPRLFVGQSDDLPGRAQAKADGGIWINNPQPENGPLSSIWLALERLPPRKGFLLWPVDHPLVSSPTIDVLLNAATEHPEELVVPSFEKRRGHPVIFPAWAAQELRLAPLEKGARWLIQRHPDKVLHINVKDRWVCGNLDTPELLAEAERVLGLPVGSE